MKPLQMPTRRRSPISVRRAARSVTVESMEARRLLAVAALYYNETYTETDPNPTLQQSALKLRQELVNRGYTVRTFTDLNSATLSTNLAGADVLVMPRFKAKLPVSLYPDASKTVVRNFVTGGGGYLQVGDTAFEAGAQDAATYENDEVLSTTFGYGAFTRNVDLGGNATFNSTGAVGTTFASGSVASVPASLLTVSVTVPSGTSVKSIYTIDNRTAVGLFSYGNRNSVGFVGYDFLSGAASWGPILTKALDQVKRSGTTTPTAPAAASGLTATAASASQINLAWNDNSSNETGFRVEVATTSGGAFTTLATVGAGVKTYSHTGLAASTTRYYRIVALNGTLAASPSNTASATTQAATTTPAAPTTLAATAPSSTSVKLTWADKSTNETGFRVQRATNSTFTTGLVTSTAAANATTVTLTGLTANTLYYFRVYALNGTLVSGASNVVSIRTPVTPPAAPTTLAGTAVSPTSIKLTWADKSTNETGFRIQRATNSTFTTGLVTTTTAANATTSTLTGLTANTLYYFRVYSLNGTSASTASNVISLRTPVAPPLAPTTLAATAPSSTSVKLTWADKSTNETGFRVQRATNSTFTTGLVTSTAAANATTVTLTGLTANTVYYFRVYSLIGTVTSAAPSNTVSIRTPVTPPAAPTTLTATRLSSTSLRLNWLDKSTNETGFRIQRATNSAFTTGLVTSTAATNATTATLSGLVAGTTYYFRVYSLIGSVTSTAASNVVSIKL